MNHQKRSILVIAVQKHLTGTLKKNINMRTSTNNQNFERKHICVDLNNAKDQVTMLKLYSLSSR